MCNCDLTYQEFKKFHGSNFEKFSKILEEKLDTTEKILEEALKCRSWADIKANARYVITYEEDGNKIETWFYEDTKILSVRLVTEENIFKFKFEKFV